MIFSQKVFVNDNPIVLTTDKKGYVSLHPEAAKYTGLKGAGKKNLQAALTMLEDGAARGVIVEDKTEDELMKALNTAYHPLDAGGGVVFNEAGELLMIFRRGKWDLPKGKLDKGETIEACALREVSEETGLIHLTIEHKVCNTYHIYNQDKDQLVKRTAWYKMKGTSADKLAPEAAEKILEARWIGPAEISSLAAKSYEAVREVLRATGVKF